MNTTIFNTPILSTILHHLAKFILYLAGWKVEGKLPDLPKFVLIGAPHTSNWDFVMFLVVIFYLRANASFIGKAEIFRGPFGNFFRWCGGIPVDRTQSSGLVEQMVQASERSDHFILTITPEGTRHQVGEWKRGFYHIAKGAGIPVVIAVINGTSKAVEIGPVFTPTEDIEADMKVIHGFYRNVQGINPRPTREVNDE